MEDNKQRQTTFNQTKRQFNLMFCKVYKISKKTLKFKLKSKSGHSPKKFHTYTTYTGGRFIKIQAHTYFIPGNYIILS